MKMNKLLTSTAMLAMMGSIGTTVVSTATAFADTTSDQTAQVALKGGSGPSIDPIDPDKPVGDTNKLAAPSFGFGEHTINGKAQNGLEAVDYSNRLTDHVDGDGSTNTKLNVSDLSGNGTGWDVSAKLGNFVGYNGLGGLDTDAKIDGSVMHLAEGTVDTYSEGTAIVNPTGHAADLTAGGAEATILNANENEGMGQFSYDLGGKAKLDVANGLKAANYVAPLTYTIKAAPGAPL